MTYGTFSLQQLSSYHLWYVIANKFEYRSLKAIKVVHSQYYFFQALLIVDDDLLTTPQDKIHVF